MAPPPATDPSAAPPSPPAHDAEQVHVARQVIVDREQRIVGYELLYRHAAHPNRADFADDVQAGARVLSNLLTHMGMDWLLGDRLAFINVSPAMLTSELIELLPPARVVLELVGTAAEAPLAQSCRTLRARGFRIALDGTPGLATTPLADLADYVKIDLQALGPASAADVMRAWRGARPQFVACKVETPAEFRACRELGFDAFQGFHFAHPEIMSARALDAAQARVIELLNMVRNNAEFGAIEAAFKRDVALAVRLLRYINSAGFGAARRVRSINHALTLLGYRQLYRWLCLLVLAAGDRVTPPALARTALARGRLTELLGQAALAGQEHDNLFIVGLFSLVDAILGQPMAEVLGTLSLPSNIHDALLHGTGVYGPCLALARACESGDWHALASLCRQTGMSPERVSRCHLEALAWAEDLPL